MLVSAVSRLSEAMLVLAVPIGVGNDEIVSRLVCECRLDWLFRIRWNATNLENQGTNASPRPVGDV